jgi:tetratricopeptide (TPR) repeat protein
VAKKTGRNSNGNTADQTALERSRKHQSSKQWPEAIAAVREGLADVPGSSILHAELAYLLILAAREDEAVQHLEAGAGAERGHDAIRMLAHHFHCRLLAATKLKRPDPAATTGLKLARSLAEAQGIDLEPMPGIKLSACMIVKNEGKHLRDCLHSISGLVDEIVVVDTGSTDDTLKIAKSFRAKTGRFEWCDDFSAARNRSLELATGDWVLWIDADERVASHAEGAILSAIVRPHFGGYTVPIINFLNEDEAQDQVQHRPCRLFRRLPGVRFEGRIHEQIAPSIEALGLPIARLEGVTIGHYGYRAAEMADKGKHERTIGMLRNELAQNPEDGFHLFNLANALFTAGEFSEAASLCERAVSKLQPGVSHAQFCYQLWAFALYRLDRHAEALEACSAAEAAGCGGQLVEYARALALLALDNPDEALSSAEKALAMSLSEEETGDRSIAMYKAEFLRGQIFAKIGDSAAAIASFKAVLDCVPRFSAARLLLAFEYRKTGQLGLALEVAEACIENSDNGRAAAELAALCAQELGLTQDACRIWEKAWRCAPERPDLCLAWAHSAEDAGDWWTAAKAYNAYLCRYQPTAAVMINAGRALEALNKNQAALDCFSRAIDLSPGDPNAYFNVGDLLYKCQKYTDAALAYRSGLARETDNAEAWFTLGNALYYSGSPDGAALAFEQALRLDPTHERAAENLGLVFDDIKRLAS